MSSTISRIYEAAGGDYFMDRDGNGAVDGHFTIDYDRSLIGVDINNDHVADYVYQMI